MENKKILLVDDEEEALFFLSKILQRNNYHVLSAAQGKEAVILARKERPDLIILDISMPDMDGGEVVAALEEDRSTKNIPVIFLTALVTKDEAEGKTIGQRHIPIIAKPVNERDLLKVIKQQIFS